MQVKLNNVYEIAYLKMNQTNFTESLGITPTFDPITNLLIPLSISIIGAFCGAYFGLRFARQWDRTKKDEENNATKKLVVENILEELRDTKNMFNDPIYKDAEWDDTNQTFKGGHISISTPVFQGLVNSGNFSLLPTSLQTKIGRVYLYMEKVIFFTNQLLTFYTVPTGTHKNIEGRKLTLNLKTKANQLRNELDMIIPELESFKNNL